MSGTRAAPAAYRSEVPGRARSTAAVIVDPRTFTLRTATDAHRAVEDGSARGKIVVVDVP